MTKVRRNTGLTFPLVFRNVDGKIWRGSTGHPGSKERALRRKLHGHRWGRAHLPDRTEGRAWSAKVLATRSRSPAIVDEVAEGRKVVVTSATSPHISRLNHHGPAPDSRHHLPGEGIKVLGLGGGYEC